VTVPMLEIVREGYLEVWQGGSYAVITRGAVTQK